MKKTVNFYDENGTWICERELRQIPSRDTELTLVNPSGLIYSGSVESIADDRRFEGEIAVHVIGFWEWEEKERMRDKKTLIHELTSVAGCSEKTIKVWWKSLNSREKELIAEHYKEMLDAFADLEEEDNCDIPTAVTTANSSST